MSLEDGMDSDTTETVVNKMERDNTYTQEFAKADDIYKTGVERDRLALQATEERNKQSLDAPALTTSGYSLRGFHPSVTSQSLVTPLIDNSNKPVGMTPKEYITSTDKRPTINDSFNFRSLDEGFDGMGLEQEEQDELVRSVYNAYGEEERQDKTTNTYPKAMYETNSTDYPDHIYKGEMQGHEHLATQIHGSKDDTIGKGIDLRVYDGDNAKYLLKAGVSQAKVNKLLKFDKSVRITEEQANEASDYAYADKYKMVKSLLHRRSDVELEELTPKMKAMAVNLGYNGYLVAYTGSKNSHLDVFRSNIWKYVTAEDEEGLLDYIKNADLKGFAKRGQVERRFERGGFYKDTEVTDFASV